MRCYNLSIVFSTDFAFLRLHLNYRYVAIVQANMQNSRARLAPGCNCIINFYSRGLLVCRSDDNGKIGSLKGSAADKAAVNVGHGKQFFSILCVHAAAVLNCGSGCNALAVKTCDDVSDDAANLVSLLGGCGLAGADSPDGFISDDDILHIVSSYAEKVDLRLHGDDFGSDALFSLFEELTLRPAASAA